ncbi:hypothetical protein [Streptomyces gobiensis]|uniref:hypothetical protein n=1 Tax=Streptomyces gobiensis TaxID=2875706 RepID=UPI001E2D1390|nr:hypothetical protein [Streptomyces gobiensis]UGY93923.1 hypothetical protein test1122_20850 [Streptomyces gobiensis]
MSSPDVPSPSPDAAVIYMGRRHVRNGLIAAGVIGLLVVNGAFSTMAGTTGEENALGLYLTVIALLLVFGGLGAFGFVRMWKGRNRRVSVDHTGLWFHDGKAEQVIPWGTIAGVGLYSSPFGRGGRVYSLELCPNGRIDRDDPVLWPLVRNEEPLDPSLPRLRHRIRLTLGSHAEVAEAVQRYVPQLWLGEDQRSPGHIGKPDVEGHRARTSGRTP